MKFGRLLHSILVWNLVAGNFLLLSVASAQTVTPSRKEDFFSAKGVLTRIDSVTKVLYLRNESGLELTYHVDDSTKAEVPFSTLAVNDAVEIDYRYNENYEKIALSLRKQPPLPAPPPSKS